MHFVPFLRNKAQINMQSIKLESSDKQIFDVEIAIAQCSGTISKSYTIQKQQKLFFFFFLTGTMMEDLGIDEKNSGNEIVPLPNVNAAILSKVIEFCTYHKDDPPLNNEDDTQDKRTDDISSWDVDFLKVDQGTLFELILAANYLDIRSLLDVTCKTVANLIKGKTADEIRKTFNIKNDFTEAEAEQIRKENTWCEEK
jgi:S-phase kinase-associated protein 1